ncbi:MAG: D-tyrosyl-tRNA(Tyr) deacylase [Proteobacteria bacterium]|nr:D-tyrosyl-tRNA(Tyr) deacylase [Pseudomonadota bacterium]
MRAVVQRVSEASVTVGGETIGRIDGGLMVLVGVEHDDTTNEAQALAGKLATMRVFPDANDKMNLSLEEVQLSILVVSQFTLAADVSKGRRPSFTSAAAPELAEPLVDELVATLRGRGLSVATGKFGAMMEVSLTNAGPVTFVLDI